MLCQKRRSTLLEAREKGNSGGCDSQQQQRRRLGGGGAGGGGGGRGRISEFNDHIFTSSRNQKFQIRQARLSDVPELVAILKILWFNSPLSQFQNPYRHQYPEDLYRTYRVMSRQLLFDVRQVTMVAVPLDDEKEKNIVAYARFVRKGDDAYAREFTATRWSLWFIILGWYFALGFILRQFLWPDRSVDKAARTKIWAARQEMELRLWKGPEMQKAYGNRWHVTHLMTSSAWQRQGLGQHLMQIVMDQAEKEQVVVGLEATDEGERLYTQMGFQVRARSDADLGGYQEACMMWTPSIAGYEMYENKGGRTRV